MRAARVHFTLVGRNVCLETFMVNFPFCVVLSVQFFLSTASFFFICDFKSPRYQGW